jgi:small nuclear ribonucleoprotein (snRNP)-like protein
MLNMPGWLHSVLFGIDSTVSPPPPSNDAPQSLGNIAQSDAYLEGDVTTQGPVDTNGHSPPPAESEGQRWLEQLLSQTVRVEISDGRVIYGRLMCTDRDLNLVLGHAEEHGPAPGIAGEVSPTLVCRRQIGVVMIPGKHIVSCAVDATA